MSVHFETYQTEIHSTTLVVFSFGFTEGSFLPFKRPKKHLRSVAEDLIINKQKELTNLTERRRHGYYKTVKPIFFNRS